MAPDNTETNNHYTPRKARREIITPSKHNINPSHPARLDPYDSPSVFRRLFSPTTHRQSQQPSPLPLKTAIGPTPQRNGKILGLFDMLSASGGSTATPSAKRVTALDHAVVQTPSRRKMGQKLDGIPESADNEGNVGDDDEYEHTIAMGRTPASSSKRLYLERLFATPTTLRFATMMEDEENNQPQRILYQKAEEAQTDDKDALASGTPSFLRRSNSGRYMSSNDNDPANPLSPIGVRKHQRYNGKGLSALVQGLRDMENERMEDDWDVLNEIEAEQTNGTAGENVQVGDSQVPQLNAASADSNGGRVWKKKGQKRTTRLIKMKPVMQVKNKPPRTTTAKPSKSAEQNKNEDDDDEESEDELQTSTNPKSPDGNEESLPQTRSLRERKQITEDNANQDDANEDEEEEEYNEINSDDNSSDSDFTETASTKQPIPTTTIKPTSSFSEKLKAAFSSVQPLKKKKIVAEKHDEEKQKASPKKRKVNPDTHANYRSLKIRSRGQGRFGKRFGRR